MDSAQKTSLAGLPNVPRLTSFDRTPTPTLDTVAEKTPFDPLAAGTVFDRYVIHRHLGRTTRNDIYTAYDFALDRPVVLKFRTSGEASDEVRSSDVQEALSKIEGAHAEKICNYGRFRGVPFVALQLEGVKF